MKLKTLLSLFTLLRQDGHGDTERAYMRNFVANAQKMDTLPGISSLNPLSLDCKKKLTVYPLTQSTVFFIDNAHLMYNAHPKLFRRFF
jgi:hypothetical protein